MCSNILINLVDVSSLLTVGGAIPWLGPGLVRRNWAVSLCSLLCLLTVDLMWASASISYCLSFPAMLNCALDYELKSIFSSLFSLDYFITAAGRRTEICTIIFLSTSLFSCLYLKFPPLSLSVYEHSCVILAPVYVQIYMHVCKQLGMPEVHARSLLQLLFHFIHWVGSLKWMKN